MKQISSRCTVHVMEDILPGILECKDIIRGEGRNAGSTPAESTITKKKATLLESLEHFTSPVGTR